MRQRPAFRIAKARLDFDFDFRSRLPLVLYASQTFVTRALRLSPKYIYCTYGASAEPLRKLAPVSELAQHLCRFVQGLFVEPKSIADRYMCRVTQKCDRSTCEWPCVRGFDVTSLNPYSLCEMLHRGNIRSSSILSRVLRRVRLKQHVW
jgi:hypothetical protein